MWQPTDNYLAHSRGPWKKHKYVAVKNGRYIYPGESVEGAARNYRQAAKTAAREQERGKARTEREKRRLEEGYYKERSSKNYGDRLNAKRKELLRSHGSKSMDAARRVDEQMRMADRIYSKGKMREYEKAHGYDKAKTKGKNPTYKKNQRRAKLESLIFKGKRAVKKLLKNIKKRSEPKVKVTVSSNLMPAGTKKDITKQYNDMKKKKKR